jgi:hypothetical protein
MVRSLWTAIRLQRRELWSIRWWTSLKLAHYRVQTEAEDFKFIKFGGMFICHRALRAVAEWLQLCGWQ